MVNPIKVGNFALLFNCTLVGWTSDSGPDALAVVGPTVVYLLDFFCSSIQFYVLLSPFYLCFISFFIS